MSKAASRSPDVVAGVQRAELARGRLGPSCSSTGPEAQQMRATPLSSERCACAAPENDSQSVIRFIFGLVLEDWKTPAKQGTAKPYGQSHAPRSPLWGDKNGRF